MKILHIENGRCFYGGPQQVLYLCSGLNDHGIENILICQPESDLGKIAKDHGIRVIWTYPSHSDYLKLSVMRSRI